MGKLDNIYKMTFVKMGQWATPTADSENWHAEPSSVYFKKVFGLYKGSWVVANLEDGMTHIYFPKYFFIRLQKQIKRINKSDYKSLERKLRGFYHLQSLAKKEIPKLSISNYSKLTNKQLVHLFKQNKDWTHRITVYDQFGWLAEEYLTDLMDKLLEKYGLSANSQEYHKALFVLTKPEKISTTLSEKRDILYEAIATKKGKSDLIRSSNKLAHKYGWMPVFAYGEPWGSEHYKKEIKVVMKRSVKKINSEYDILKEYVNNRNKDFFEVVDKYGIKEKDQQVFIDFGLALDARNEAEYLVSFCGFYLRPIYNEITKRLYLSIKQLRNMRENEIISALQGKIDPLKILEAKEGMLAWGFDHKMKDRFFLNGKEAKKFFIHLEKTVKNIQGNIEGKGICASPGIVRGRAKITHYPSENNKVKNGDILITHATTVDYLPAMKRASAFVTEIGGLTCHAAVVAREFNVPCIVGLKDATKNFKDGDLVEVDANEGIVRKVISKK
jgi:phosphohistidine swiveling domain-containing protein